MGFDLNYNTSRILTKQEVEDLKSGKLYFENKYSLSIITKEEAEKIKALKFYEAFKDIIVEEESERIAFIEELREAPETIENYIFENHVDGDEIPCSLKEKEDYLKDMCCSLLDFNSFNYKGEEIYIIVEIRYD